MAAEAHALTCEPGSAAHARFITTRTFGSLDGLRAIAILAVVWHHTHEVIPGWPISGRGFLGVDLFFEISGFLIMTLILRERRRTGTISLRKFYVRRFLRIFPPYYALLLVVGAIAFGKSGAGSAAILRDLPYSLLYVANLVPMTSILAITWSLAVEEQFYLVVPAFAKALPRAAPILLALAYVLVSLPPFGVAPGLPLPSFFRQTTFGPILLGVLLAYLLDTPRVFRRVQPILAHPLASVVALALMLFACNLPGDDVSGWPRLAMHGTMLLLLATTVSREDNTLAPGLGLWPVRRIGAVSYGIYLFHLFVKIAVDHALSRWGPSAQFLTFLGTAVGTWAVAEASYRLFESRFLALKERWA